MPKYITEDLVMDGWPKPTQWGVVAHLPDGRWRTTWTFEMDVLDETCIDEVVAAAAKPAAGFAVTLQPHKQNELVAVIDTNRWGMETDYYGFTYLLFKLIDTRVGRIRLIQGSPREWYPPFIRG